VGHGLPVLSTNVYTMGKIITENGFGQVAEEDPKAYAAAIEDMLSNREKLNSYRQTMKKSMEEKHLWVHRIDKIVEDMTGVRK
jgi:glycosyltransferase involved in cell wall biosynthesis